MQGINAAKLLPKSNSPSVVGVAKRGSRLRSTFSPTKLYDPMIEARAAGMMTK